jgi:hypothetical protein
MQADASEAVAMGVFHGPEVEISILVVVAFVEEQLLIFSQRYTNSAIQDEKGLNSRLHHLLQWESINRKYPFLFEKDPPEKPESGQSPSPDLGVFHQTGITIGTKYYTEDESFFSLEAKILGVKERSRQREYVIGSEKANGGIERFKKRIHGSKLDYGCMLGYILKHDFNHWHTQVNTWIDEEIRSGHPFWNENDKLLVKNMANFTARYESCNSRVGIQSLSFCSIFGYSCIGIIENANRLKLNTSRI